MRLAVTKIVLAADYYDTEFGQCIDTIAAEPFIMQVYPLRVAA